MSDDFLSRLREEPRPEFEERLGGPTARDRRARARAPARRRAPAGASCPPSPGASLVAALALAFTLEPVRAAAREFLDLFRVKRFAAVPVDPAAARAAREGRARLQEPGRRPGPGRGGAAGAGGRGEPGGGRGRGRHHRPPAERAAAPARSWPRPRWAGPAPFRVQVDTAKLEALALAAGADEIEIPAWWNGATIDVEMPPVLAMRYARTVDAGDGRPAARGRASSSSSRRRRRWSCRRASTSPSSAGWGCASPA